MIFSEKKFGCKLDSFAAFCRLLNFFIKSYCFFHENVLE